MFKNMKLATKLYSGFGIMVVVAGKVNKAIASTLGLSHKTIEFHRNKIMEKMRAQSVVDLLRMALTAESCQGSP